MTLYDDIRRQAKLDSRRFGKSIVCRIVTGQLLDIIYSKNLLPTGVYINYRTGLDPINNKMVVIPVSRYDNVVSLLTNYQREIKELDGQDIEIFERIANVDEPLVSALKQDMILVTVTPSSIPEGLKAGAPVDTYDVLIDSVDVNQVIEATYVFRNNSNLRQSDIKWDRGL